MHSPIIVLAAGGTGGHIFPAMALAEQLVARGATPVFLTDARFHGYKPPEMQQVLAGMQVIEIATGRNGGGMITRAKNMLGIVRGVLQAKKVLARLKPAAVIGFGGYPSLPTMLAAALRTDTCFLHEQNAYVGRTNRFFSTFFRCTMLLSYANTSAIPRQVLGHTHMVGNPVRSAMQMVGDSPYPARSGLQPFHLLVIGGSQGASVFGRVVPEAVALLPAELRAQLRITQQCRNDDLEAVQAAYAALGVQAELAAFFPDIATKLVGAHLVVSRAGASSVAEMCVAGKPAVYVPLPSAMDNHQWFNAKAAADAGAAWLVTQAEFSAETLAETLKRASSEIDILPEMARKAKALAQPNAAAALAELVLKETV